MADIDLPSATDGRNPPAGWERDVLERLMFATLREQRAARRWRIFFRLMWLLMLLLFVAALLNGGNKAAEKGLTGNTRRSSTCAA